MKKLLIAVLLLVPAMGLAYKDAASALAEATAEAGKKSKEGWARVGEIKRDAGVIIAQLKQQVEDNKAAINDPKTPEDLINAFAAGLGDAEGAVSAWDATLTKINDEIIAKSRPAFLIGNAQYAVDLKKQVKQGADADATVKGDTVWAQL